MSAREQALHRELQNEPVRERRPDAASEARLLQLRREAERTGHVEAAGVQPLGAPFPKASPATGYYGIHLLKEPQWNWAVPLYFFVGGAAGAAAVVGNVAEFAGDDYELASDARWIALGGAAVSGAILVYDLGKPTRFLNMLRVIKPQSPMSVGAWVLAAFSAHAAAAKFADVVRERFGDALPVRVISKAANAGSIFWGLPFSNYTGVLIGATALPVWNRNVSTLPIHFGASGLQSAVAMLELWGHAGNPALNWLGMAAAAYEVWEGLKLESDAHPAQRPLKHGVSGAIVRAGGVLSGPVPLGLRIAAAFAGERNSRQMRRWAAMAGIAGSLLTRYGWMRAGHTSARDWRLPLEISEDSAADERVLSKAKVPQVRSYEEL